MSRLSQNNVAAVDVEGDELVCDVEVVHWTWLDARKIGLEPTPWVEKGIPYQRVRRVVRHQEYQSGYEFCDQEMYLQTRFIC